MIFRKISDVKREEEERLRRKNEAPLNLPPDHPVRRLFQRFRQQREARRLAAEQAAKEELDPESGTLRVLQDDDRAVLASTSLVTETESPITSASSIPCSAPASAPSVKPQTPALNSSVISGGRKATEPAKGKGWGRFKEAVVSGENWGKVSKAESLETLPDRTKSQEEASLKKTDSCDSGITKSDLRLDNVGEVRSPQDRSPVQPGLKQAFCPIPEHTIQASFLELKRELKEDISALSGRMAALEGQLAETLRILRSRRGAASPERIFEVSQPESPASDKDDAFC